MKVRGRGSVEEVTQMSDDQSTHILIISWFLLTSATYFRDDLQSVILSLYLRGTLQYNLNYYCSHIPALRFCFYICSLNLLLTDTVSLNMNKVNLDHLYFTSFVYIWIFTVTKCNFMMMLNKNRVGILFKCFMQC